MAINLKKSASFLEKGFMVAMVLLVSSCTSTLNASKPTGSELVFQKTESIRTLESVADEAENRDKESSQALTPISEPSETPHPEPISKKIASSNSAPVPDIQPSLTPVKNVVFSETSKAAEENRPPNRKIIQENVDIAIVEKKSEPGFFDGPLERAQFSITEGGDIAPNGYIYIADILNHRIRQIDTNEMVSTLAGSGVAGFQDGAGTSAQFDHPTIIAFNPVNQSIYVGDIFNQRLRKVDKDGNVSTIEDFKGVVGGLTVGQSGNVYISSKNHHQIFKLNIQDEIELFAGSGESGNDNGSKLVASFNHPSGICIDTAGNLYIADSANHSIRKISSNGQVSTYAGKSRAGYVDGTSEDAEFNEFRGILPLKSLI